jgi:hypothetical protein
MTLTRNRYADLFALAQELGPYDFWPVLPPGQDPQLHASRNDRPQPFHLVHEHDAILVHFTGSGRVEFPEGPVRWHDLSPGDHVYLPAGLPYRVLAEEVCLQVLMKAEHAGLEGVAWYCQGCGDLLSRSDFDTETEQLQRGLFRNCVEFNADVSARTCGGCGSVHPEVELADFHWLEVAEQIENPAPAAEPQWAAN